MGNSQDEDHVEISETIPFRLSTNLRDPPNEALSIEDAYSITWDSHPGFGAGPLGETLQGAGKPRRLKPDPR